MMKVFKIDDTDFICAETKEKAIEYYVEQMCADTPDDTEIVECDTSFDTMWYGFYIDDGFHKFIVDNKDQVFEMKWDNRQDFDCVLKLTYEKVIEYENIKESCLIASTEF